MVLLYGLNYGLKKSNSPHRIRTLAYTSFGVIIWMSIMAFAAGRGFFAQWDALPPRLIMVLVPNIIIFIARSKMVNKLVHYVPREWPVGVQSFRILMEICLWWLALEAIIPERMSFEGWNFDILTGLTAPLIAWAIAKGKASNSLILWWNIFGLFLVTFIVVIAIMSMPTPFQVFTEEPANRVMAYLPFIWLPGFVVPVAYLMHIVSIKQVTNKPPESN